MNDMQKNMVAAALRQLVSDKYRTDVELDQLIEKYRADFTTGSFSSISNDDYSAIAREVKANCYVVIDEGPCIFSKDRKKWFLDEYSKSDKRFWIRYRKWLLTDEGYAPNVLKELDRATNTIMDGCGNPNSEMGFSKHGMVIGDVQSGKTGTYIGLMCKAADVGYQVFIVLTGITSMLRSQTQVRIDKGFTGRKSLNAEPFGVAAYDKDLVAKSITTTIDDYTENKPILLNTSKVPLVFVVKKNSRVLSKLYTNLNTIHNRPILNSVETSLMIIDDEADNASVNTSDDDPTAINRHIRMILHLFKKATYVGFTATPYANVFINAYDNKEGMGKDLFPEDFICCLGTPSNYMSARDIFDEDGKYHEMIRDLDNDADLYEKSHKNGTILETVPQSLRSALYCFILSCTIRDLGGETDKPMAMLINMSRYKSTHTSITDVIGVDFYKIQMEIENQCCMGEKALNNPTIRELKETWVKEYSNYCSGKYEWSQIQKAMGTTVTTIEYHVINSDNKATGILNYEEHPNMRIIVIGGDCLSRGLTLNGLMITYFYRSSNKYDTLMQMGRWFGYRDGYEKLCRIWIDSENVEWFSRIAEATEDLKNQISTMNDAGMHPDEFGLRIRQDLNVLKITAKNKMIHTDKTVERISLSCAVLETAYIPILRKTVISNHNACDKLISTIMEITKENGKKTSNNNLLWTEITPDIICQFVNDYSFNAKDFIDKEGLINTISSYPSIKWDVAIIHGDSIRQHYGITDTIRSKARISLRDDDGRPSVLKLNKSRLITPSFVNEGTGLKATPKSVKDAYQMIPGNKEKSPPTSVYLANKTKGLLMIHYLDLSVCEQDKEEVDNVFATYPEGICPIGIAFAFPKIDGEYIAPTYYITNTVWEKIKNEKTEQDDDSEEIEDEWYFE